MARPRHRPHGALHHSRRHASSRYTRGPGSRPHPWFLPAHGDGCNALGGGASCVACGGSDSSTSEAADPPVVEGTWSPVIHTDADCNLIKEALYSTATSPARHALLRAHHRHWYGMQHQYIVQRALGSPNETVARRAYFSPPSSSSSSPCTFFIIPGLFFYLLIGAQRKIPSSTGMIGPDGQLSPRSPTRGFP